MMRSDPPSNGYRHGDGKGENSTVEQLLAEYVDRLNRGEKVSAREILSDHPDLGGEILESLESFMDIVSDPVEDEPLGTLGDYTLRRQIGRGGMGVVYDAWQNSVDRQVALKVLPPGVAADEKALQRFIREAKTAGQLNHQNVVAVYSTGVEESTPWYSMEYVEGETLAQILPTIRDADRETQTVFGHKDSAAYFDKLARSFADVADGLQHAHAKGVVHRDIKPSNLILDQEDRLRILDFGLARLEGEESLTISGDVVGTPLYMSPEQARRRKIPVDHRTDVYSLGATMYEAITGRPPVKGKDHQDTLSQIIERDPVKPRTSNLRVPKDLETIVLKCLRKDTRDRYGTAEALAQDLRRFVRGDPIEARPRARWERVVARLRRHRTKLLVATAILVPTLSVVWLLYQWDRAQHQAKVERYPRLILEVLKKIHTGQFSLRVVAGETKGLPRLSGRPVSPLTPEDFRLRRGARGADPLEKAVRELAEVAGAVDRPEAHYHLARAYRLLGRTEEALEEVEQALACDAAFVPAEILRLELQAHSERQEAARIEEFLPRYGESDWQTWWLLAYRSMARREWSNAVAAYDRLIGLPQEPYVGFLPEAHLRRGVARLRTRNYERAKGDFWIAGHLAPGFEPVLLLGKAYYLNDQKAEAEETFARLYEDAEDRAEAALWIVAVYDSLRDYRKGHEWVKKLVEVPCKERLNAYFLSRLARTREAISAGRRATARNPGDPIAHLVLAWDLWSGRSPERDARLDELVAVSERAVELNPDNASAQALLAAAEAERNAMRTTVMWVPMVVALGGMAQAEEGFFAGVVPAFEKPLPFDITSGASVTRDGRTFFSSAVDRGGAGSWDIFTATRDRTTDDEGNPVPFGEPVNLGPPINTPDVECTPCISYDGLTLYFSRRPWPSEPGAGDLWVATRKSTGDGFDGFDEPVRLEGVNTTSSFEFLPSITKDGLELYFIRGWTEDPVFWVATRESTDHPFDEPVRLEEGINSVHRDHGLTTSADGLALFFYSDRPGGEGDFDVWIATRERRRDEGGNRVPFDKPVNLGPPINTPANEAGIPDWDWPASGSQLGFARWVGDFPQQHYIATWHPDCNGNGEDDLEDVTDGVSKDSNQNEIPDECELQFLRGDCNDDGDVDLSDAVCILDWLFLGGPEPGCIAVTNVNGDGGGDIQDAVNITDPVVLLAHLFLGGPAPVEPFPHCGPMPDGEELACDVPPTGCQ